MDRHGSGHRTKAVEMPQLVVPSLRAHRSFLDALGEYHAEGLHQDLAVEDIDEPAAFHAWVEQLRVAGLDGTADFDRDRVPHRIMWWVCGEDYIGRVRINLELNDELLEFGGHVGYDIRPSARRQGHATALLTASLREAGSLGLKLALLTCAPDNVASRKVIERNGGVLRDTSRAGRLRYWCATT